jgi:hypothetical protein
MTTAAAPATTIARLRNRADGRPGTRARTTELCLILLATAAIALYVVAADEGATGALSPLWWILPSGVAVAGLAAHVVVRLVAPYADQVLLPCAVLINGIGVVFLHRLDLADQQGGAAAAGASILAGQGPRQLVWTIGAVVIFAAGLVFIRDHRALSRYGYTFALAGCLLVITPVLLPARILGGIRIQTVGQIRVVLRPTRRVRKTCADSVFRAVPGA